MFLANVFDKAREARQGARLRGRPSAACAGKLAGKLCGQAFEFAFDKCAREELDEINVFVNVFDKVAPENREARRGRGRLGQGRA